jgi:hypothetical protein
MERSQVHRVGVPCRYRAPVARPHLRTDTNVAASALSAALAAGGHDPVLTDAVWRGLVPRAQPSPADLATAAARVAALAPGEAVPPSAGAVFTLANLPDTVRRLHRRYSVAELNAVSRTLGRLALPLQRMLERVAVRPVPSPAQVAAELDEAVAALAARGSGREDCQYANGNGAPPAWRELYAALPAMMAGRAKPPPAPGLDASGRRTIVAAVSRAEPKTGGWAGNDDAQLEGCLRNPMRIGMFSQYWLLVGGWASKMPWRRCTDSMSLRR